jgi:hypothetical protein
VYCFSRSNNDYTNTQEFSVYAYTASLVSFTSKKLIPDGAVNSVIPTDYNFLVVNIIALTITSVGNIANLNSRDKEK